MPARDGNPNQLPRRLPVSRPQLKRDPLGRIPVFRFVIGVLLMVAVTACEPGARVRAATWLHTPVETQMLTLTVTDGDRSWQWWGGDFRPSNELGMPHSPERATRTSGELIVAFRLTDTAQVLLSEGQVTLPLKNDWRWRVDFVNTTEDPVRQCFGCAGSRAFPLPAGYRTPGFDSLWIVWGGNSIKNPVIY